MISRNFLKKAKKLGNYGPLEAHYILCSSERVHALCGAILLEL